MTCIDMQSDEFECIKLKVFFIFAAFNLISILFVQFFLPETKDKSLEEIQSHFKKN